MFWLSTAGLLVVAVFFIVFPMFKRNNPGGNVLRRRRAANIAIYEERFSELRRELEEKNLDQSEFEDLVAELKRNLLTDAEIETGERGSVTTAVETSGALSSSPEPGPVSDIVKTSRGLPFLLILLMPFMAYGMYAKLGYYEDIRFSELFQQALHAGNNPTQATALVMSLKEAVAEDKDNQWAWYFLGRNYFSLGLYDKSQNAYRNAIRYMETGPNKVMVMGQFVLASYMNADQKITDEARAVADRALAINANDPTIVRVLAADARQRMDYSQAIEYWRRLVRISPGSSAAKVYRSNIAAAEKLLGTNKAADSLSTGIEVSLSLATGVDLPPNLRVFVAARNAERPGMPPLAAVDLTVADLPTQITLDKSSAVGPFDLSSAKAVYVSALVSLHGSANPQPGDLRVVSEAFERMDERSQLSLVISETVP